MRCTDLLGRDSGSMSGGSAPNVARVGSDRHFIDRLHRGVAGFAENGNLGQSPNIIWHSDSYRSFYFCTILENSKKKALPSWFKLAKLRQTVHELNREIDMLSRGSPRPTYEHGWHTSLLLRSVLNSSARLQLPFF